MNSLLAKIATRKAFGVYIDEHEVVVCKAGATPFGPVEISSERETIENGQVGSALERLLRRRKAFRTPVAVGIPSNRVFFTTRPTRATNQDASPQALLQEVLQSSSVAIEDPSVDVIRSEIDGRSLASIVSCSKKYLSTLLEQLEPIGVRPVRVEPAPCGLLRVAAKTRPATRRTKAELRIFLGEARGLAALTTPHSAAVWRYFDLPRGHEASAIVSITRSLQTLSKPCGISTKLNRVVIHGRDDLRTLLELEGLSDQLGIGATWCDGPALDNAAVAYGLAIGCLYPEDMAFDLARSLKSPATLRDIFPWGELALQGSLVFCMGLFLTNRAWTWHHASTTSQAEINRDNAVASVTESELAEERKDLTRRVEAIRKFVATRVNWTGYTHDIAESLPPNATIGSVHGVSEFESSATKKTGGAKQKKSFVLRGSVPIAKNGSVPHEIDEFMDRLRDNANLKRDFPEVELADIKWFQPLTGTPPHAQFTIVCLPKPTKKPAKSIDNFESAE